MCTDPQGAQSTLRKQGFTNIRTTGYRYFAGEDTYITEFAATAPNGEPSTGIVTRGMWEKGSTIRLDD